MKDPERILCAAVLKSAVTDFVSAQRGSRSFLDARAYLFEGVGNFEWLAGTLDLDVEAVREGVLKRREETK